VNNIQKIFLIIAFASFGVFIFVGIGGEWLITDLGESVTKSENLFDILTDKEYVTKSLGYGIHWMSAIPFIVLLSSLLGVYLFKDK